MINLKHITIFLKKTWSIGNIGNVDFFSLRWILVILNLFIKSLASGHEVFVNKKSNYEKSPYDKVKASPSIDRKVVRKPSLTRESSDDSSEGIDPIPPARPPPIKRPPQRLPAPPVPRTGKRGAPSGASYSGYIEFW